MDQLQQPMDVLDLRISLSIVSNYTSSLSMSMSMSSMDCKKIEASVTCFAVSKKENKQLFIGTEAGKIFTTKFNLHLFDGKSSSIQKAGASKENMDPISHGSTGTEVLKEVIVESYGKEEGGGISSSSSSSHFGPVTAIHFNPVQEIKRYYNFTFIFVFFV
jgi:hypothetical protein